jgi:hypothetical protein
VAPFVAPREFVAGDDRTVVVLPTDIEALAWAGGLGAGLLLRTVPRARRTRTLTSPAAPRAVVVSLESLESRVLQRELREELGGAAWLLPRADALSSLADGGAARREQLDRLHEACGGGPLLQVHASNEHAPPEAPVELGVPGALRWGRGARGRLAASLLVPTGGGLVGGPDALGEELGHELGEVGLPRRSHELARLQARPWTTAIEAVADGGRGVDAFPVSLTTVPGRAVLALGAVVSSSELTSTDGSALGVLRVSAIPVPAVDSTVIEACRAALSDGREDAAWFAVPGDEERAPGSLLSDLVAVGVLASARPCALAARVADQRRFRPPAVDREPEYRALHDAYHAAMRGWSLAERARLSLTDRAPQDLRALAAVLGWEPARVADVLVAMNDDGLVTAYVEPLGGRADWQATPGPRWRASAEDIAAAIADLRVGRAQLQTRVGAVLESSGCRAQSLAEDLGTPLEEPCGRCDYCDPTSQVWPATIQRAAPASKPIPSLRAGLSGTPKRAPSLDSLFAGLGGGSAPSAAVAKKWTDPELRSALESGDPARIEEAVAEAGSPSEAWVRAGFQYAGPGGRRGFPPSEVVADLVQLLTDQAAPAGRFQGPGRRSASGSIEVRRRGGGFAGGHRFTVRIGVDVGWSAQGGSGGGLLAAAATPGDPGLQALRHNLQGRAAWTAWRQAAEGRLAEQLDAGRVLPDLRAVLASGSVTNEDGGAWNDALAVLRLVKAGSLEAALAAIPEVAGASALKTLVLGALEDWASLWEAAEDPIGAGRKPSSPLARLEARALFGVTPAPELTAELAGEWLRFAAAELGDDLDRGTSLLATVTSGTPDAFARLAKLADRGAVAVVALASRALPASLLSEVLDRDPVAALAAVRGANPARVWAQHFSGRPESEQRAWIEQLRETAPEFARAGLATFARQDEQRQLRQEIVDRASAGDLAEVVGLLPRLDSADDEIRGIAARVATAQRRFTGPLAQALVADDQEDAGWGAIEAAHAEGWLESIIALLRAQARRHPHDVRRAVWLARALAVGGQWADAERQFGEAARLADGPAMQIAVEFEGVDLAIDAGEGERVGRWLTSIVRHRRGRSVAREITLRAWGSKLPRAAVGPLLAALKKDGSGVFAGAITALDDALKKRR